MRELIFGAIAAISVFGGVYYYPQSDSSSGAEPLPQLKNGVYNLSKAEVIKRLLEKAASPDQPPFFKAAATVTQLSENTIGWSVSMNATATQDIYICVATVKGLVGNQTSVATTCNTSLRPTNIGGTITQQGFDEFVAATLQSRDMDMTKALASQPIPIPVTGASPSTTVVDGAAYLENQYQEGKAARHNDPDNQSAYLGNDPTQFTSE